MVFVKKGQACGYAYAVIGPEGGVLCNHPAVLYFIGDGVLEEVELKTDVFLTYHVLVGLKHQCGHVFLAFGRRLYN